MTEILLDRHKFWIGLYHLRAAVTKTICPCYQRQGSEISALEGTWSEKAALGLNTSTYSISHLCDLQMNECEQRDRKSVV